MRNSYVGGGKTNLYPFIQGSLECPFSEWSFSDVFLWHQHKFIALIFSISGIDTNLLL